MTDPILSTHDLGKRYGRRVGIEALNLNIERGALFGFLGPNGAGKTTTIRLLLGFLKPSTGSAQIFGLDCWRQSHRIKRAVGYLAGDVRLYSWFTVHKGLAIVQSARQQELRRSGLELAERFGLDPDVPVLKMSRGMRQKLALVLTLAPESRLLVLDEPTSGLDPLMQLALAQILRERAARGTTVLFSSHTLSEVEQLCDRVAIVRAGRIVADEALDAVRARARRKVEIRFSSSADAAVAAVPDCLRVLKRDHARWDAELEGEAAEFIRWLATQPIRDFTLGPPDLETIFHGFYRNPTSAD